MKVLHLSTFDNQRGAAIAAKRLHEALLTKGVDSWVLCDLPSGTTPKTIGLRDKPNWLKDQLRARWRRCIVALQDDPDSYYSSLNMRRNSLLNRVDALKPDVVHMHWVGKDFMRIEDLAALCGKYPVVWTLHDMWPFCGAEHVAYSEARWRDGYTKQNRPPQARGFDLNRWVWQRKLKAWTGCMIHTISVSSWMNDCVCSSKLFQGIKGHRRVIHNGIDTDVFNAPDRAGHSYTGKKDAHQQRPRIACMSTPLTNKIKGTDLFIEAMHCLHAKGIQLDITTFGGPPLPDLPPVGKYQHMGRIDDPGKLAELYASADLLVTASRMESFGQTAAEALACGTPVVCFDTSGLRDIVEHKKNGYRAAFFSPESLADGINWCLEDRNRYQSLQKHTRLSVANKFDINTIAEQTICFYHEICSCKH